MIRNARHRSPIGWLRDSTGLAALVLGLFLTSTALTVACAAHDLADVGIGADRDTSATAHQTGGGAPQDTPPADHAPGDCCHSGGHHAPAILPMMGPIAVETAAEANFALVVPETAALHQRDLRPPIH